MKPYAVLLAVLASVAALASTSLSGRSQGSATSAPAAPPSSTTAPAAQSGSAGTVSIPGAKPGDVLPTVVPDLVEVRRGADIVYMTKDGKYVLLGDLYRVSDQSNLTEMHRREIRKQLIAAVPESDMVIFSPPKPRYTVTVFTDVDCQYCRALHRQIAQYNQLGVRVRYLFFPRSGPDTSSWYKAEQVWCSSDRKAALTRAKLGQPLTAKVCPNTPVAREYELGKRIGLEGTPGIVTSTGQLLDGYMPPQELVAALQQSGSH